MALATSNLALSTVKSVLGVSNIRNIFYAGGGATLNTIVQIGAIVNKHGLNATYCPGATADARLANLLADRKMSYFKGYEHITSLATYGFLYNGYAALDVNFAPVGWHVPTKTEFETLIASLGGASIAGGKLKETGLLHWADPNFASNSSNFKAVGSGARWKDSGGGFGFLNVYGIHWSTTNDIGYPTLYYRMICTHNSESVTISRDQIYLGCSIRLIKDNSTNPGTLTDYDGNVYETVLIGSQVWIKQNWKCTKLNNGTLIPLATNAATWDAFTTNGRCAYNFDLSNV